LAELGRVKNKATVGRPSKESLSKNDNDLPPEPKHDTRKEIAKAAGVSTGKVAQAERHRHRAGEGGKCATLCATLSRFLACLSKLAVSRCNPHGYLIPRPLTLRNATPRNRQKVNPKSGASANFATSASLLRMIFALRVQVLVQVLVHPVAQVIAANDSRNGGISDSQTTAPPDTAGVRVDGHKRNRVPLPRRRRGDHARGRAVIEAHFGFDRRLRIRRAGDQEKREHTEDFQHVRMCRSV
jgi:hypothetical protein